MKHPAIAKARHQSRNGPRFAVGMCLRETRDLLGVPARAPDAIAAWNDAKHKHRITTPADLLKIPRGVPVFWSGGTGGHGHIALATGHRGRCWSTDIRRPGYFDRVPINEITARWGLTLLGWTEDLNGVRVWNPDAHR